MIYAINLARFISIISSIFKTFFALTITMVQAMGCVFVSVPSFLM